MIHAHLWPEGGWGARSRVPTVQWCVCLWAAPPIYKLTVFQCVTRCELVDREFLLRNTARTSKHIVPKQSRETEAAVILQKTCRPLYSFRVRPLRPAQQTNTTDNERPLTRYRNILPAVKHGSETTICCLCLPGKKKRKQSCTEASRLLVFIEDNVELRSIHGISI